LDNQGEIVSILTTASRAERMTLRAAREMARREAASGRTMRPLADDDLAATRSDLEKLTGAHRSAYRKLDWRPLARGVPVQLPIRTHEREKAARHLLTAYEPSWQDRMFADEADRRRELNNKVLEAAHADEVAFVQAFQAAQSHNADILLARRMLELDAAAIKDAVAAKTRLAEVRDCLNSIGLVEVGNGRLIALVDVIPLADVPYEQMVGDDRRTARRELIPESQRRQIHLAAVCAAALRVGADLVGILPVDAIEVVAECEMATVIGARPTPEPILQLLMTSKALGDLAWMKEDAITLATSINARLDWSLENGFAPIRPIALSANGQPLAKSA